MAVVTRRIAITGSPKAGKTRYSERLGAKLGVEVVHTDDYIPMGWSEASLHAADVMGKPSTVVTEGVAVPRALRKMLEARPDVKPIDRLIVLGTPRKDQSEGQRRMSLGLDTVLAELLPRLRGLGVEIEKR